MSLLLPTRIIVICWFPLLRASSSQVTTLLKVSRLILIPLIPGHIVNNECARSRAVVGACDRLKGLLPCRVPDLQLEVEPVHLYQFSPKFYTDGDLVLLSKSAIN